MILSDVENVENRARQSLGASGDHIYKMVARTIAQRHSEGGVLVDVGCGQGKLYSLVNNRFNRYLGVDAIRYDDLPAQIEFIPFDLA